MSKKGRPKGSKNRQYKEVVRLPANCPSCASTELVPVAGQTTQHMEYSGMIDGLEYDRVEWRNMRCKTCEQFLRVRTFVKL